MQARQPRGTKASKGGREGTRQQPPILTHIHTTSTIVAARPTHAVAHTLPSATTCLSTLVRDPRCARRHHRSTLLATSSSSTLSCLRYCSHTHPATNNNNHSPPLLALLWVACRWRRLSLASVATLTFGPAHLATPSSCTQPWTGSSWGPKSRGFPACNRLQICLLLVCLCMAGFFKHKKKRCCCNKHANHSSAFLAARRGSSIAA